MIICLNELKREPDHGKSSLEVVSVSALVASQFPRTSPAPVTTTLSPGAVLRGQDVELRALGWDGAESRVGRVPVRVHAEEDAHTLHDALARAGGVGLRLLAALDLGAEGLHVLWCAPGGSGAVVKAVLFGMEGFALQEWAYVVRGHVAAVLREGEGVAAAAEAQREGLRGAGRWSVRALLDGGGNGRGGECGSGGKAVKGLREE